MNVLILLAALSAPQCEGGVCAVDVEALVVSASPGCNLDAPQHVGPRRHIVKAVLHRKPLRRLAAVRPARSVFRRVAQRRPLRRLVGCACR